MSASPDAGTGKPFQAVATDQPKVWRDDIEMVIGKLSEAKAVLELVGMSDYAKLVDKPITELSRIHAEMGEAFIEPYRFSTKAQETMRHEMTMSKAELGMKDVVEDTTLKGVTSSFTDIPRIKGAMEMVVGQHEDGWETAVFIQLMPDHPTMTLDLAVWNIVQSMVEDGIRRGYQLGLKA